MKTIANKNKAATDTQANAGWYSTITSPGAYSECTMCHVPDSVMDPLNTNGAGEDGKHVSHVSIQCPTTRNSLVSWPTTRNTHAPKPGIMPSITSVHAWVEGLGGKLNS